MQPKQKKVTVGVYLGDGTMGGETPQRGGYKVSLTFGSNNKTRDFRVEGFISPLLPAPCFPFFS